MTDFKGPLMYVASPYSDPDLKVREHRYEQVSYYCAELAKKGVICFSPIAHWHPIASRWQLPTDAAYWNTFNFSILNRCDELCVLQLPGWQRSQGVAAEVAFWVTTKDKEIVYVPRG